MKKLFALIPVLIIIVSCRPKGGIDADVGYFSITKLRNKIGLTVPEVNQFKKTLNVNGESEAITIDSLNAFDIKFITDFEINKPAYRNSYAVTDKQDGFAETHIYKLKEGLKFPVKYIEYSKSANGTVFVKGDMVVKNLMTTNYKHFEGVYHPDGNMACIYRITEELVGRSPNKNVYTLERIL